MPLEDARLASDPAGYGDGGWKEAYSTLDRDEIVELALRAGAWEQLAALNAATDLGGTVPSVTKPTAAAPPAEEQVAWRFALEPTVAQEESLRRLAGYKRAVFNWGLETRKAAWFAREHEKETGTSVADLPKVPNATQLMALWPQVRDGHVLVPDRRRGAEPDGVRDYTWAQGLPSRVYQQALRDLDVATKNWFASLSGKRKGPKVGPPRFKSKRDAVQSFRFMARDVRLVAPAGAADGSRPAVPRVRLQAVPGAIKLLDPKRVRRLARKLDQGTARLTSVTVRHEGGQWWVSFLVHRAVHRAPQAADCVAVVGLDWGVRVFATLSTGEEVANPGIGARFAPGLKRLKRQLRRKVKGSRNYYKQLDRIRVLEAKKARVRRDFLHQLTARLTKTHGGPGQVLVVEDLNIKGMTRSAKGTIEAPGRNVAAKSGLNREILDLAPAEFARQLGYKGGWYGTRVIEAGRFFASTKTCSGCGERNFPGASKTYACTACGTITDRDHNAAKNLEAYGRNVLAAEGAAA